MIVTNVPLWVLKTICGGRGVRQVKRIPLQVGTDQSNFRKCSVCLQETHPGERVIRGFKVYHTTCWEKFEKFSHTSVQESYVDTSGVMPKVDERIPEGNLGDFEYRYWVGSETDKGFSMCRRCRTLVNGYNKRVWHRDDQKKWQFGLSCAQFLEEAYTVFRKKQKCIMCRAQTGKSRWDLPLCSVYCERQWKFGKAANAFLMLELDNVRSQLQAKAQAENETKGHKQRA